VAFQPPRTVLSQLRRDPLVGLEPGRGLLDLVAIKQDLEDELGCRVDVVTEAALSPYLRQQVLREAVPL
jgi:predicted nucleotidyltransferase